MVNKFLIKHVGYGIANRFDGYYIEIHRKLLRAKYRLLYNEIIKHEMAHTDKGYSKKDLLLDSKGFKNVKLYYEFIISTPSSWVQFSPIYRSRGKWYWDISLITFWTYVIFILLWITIPLLK